MRALSFFRTVLVGALLLFATCRADIPQGSLLLDAEAEAIFQEWLDKLGKAAGIPGQLHPLFLGINEVNAAATEGNRILVFTGLLEKCQSVDQLLGVLAHEVGHIRGGHIALTEEARRRAMGSSTAAIILGSAAALASGNATPLIAGLSGSSEIFMREMLFFNRIKETSSDQAVVDIAKKLKWEVIIKGLYDFLSLLKSSNYSIHPNPYLSTHPPDEERLRALERSMPSQVSSLPSDFESKFQRIRAKFIAFLLQPEQALARYPLSDTSLAARYARAIIYHRQRKNSEAMNSLDQLIREFPQDAYFHELKGQILMETGRSTEAIKSYREALKLKPKSAILKVELAKLLVDSQSHADIEEAIKLLRQLSDYRHDLISSWRLLVTAYGKSNQTALASWALAEEAYLEHDFPKAKTFAERAQRLKIADPQASRRIQDILVQVAQEKSAKQRMNF